MSTQPIRVLLIEDSPDDVQVLVQAFGRKPARVHLAVASGLTEGLSSLAQAPAELILLDLQLPDSQGIDTLVKVRAAAGPIPIVVLTASDDEALVMDALQHGAQDYLVKGYVRVFPQLLDRSIRYAIERQRAEEELRAAHAQTAQLLTSLPSILIGITSGGVITHWNAVAEATLGTQAKDALHRSLADCGVEWDHRKILAALAGAGGENATTRLDEVPFKRRDGGEGVLGLTLVPLRGGADGGGQGFLLCGADITERQQAESERLRLQQQLAQAQKMETIGRFAGGIAHDFNNFLQVILGFAWLIRSNYRHDSALLRDLQEISHAAESASGMVRQLLAFGRRKPMDTRPTDVNQAVEGMGRLLQQFVRDRIQVRLELAPGPLVVKLDPTGFEQMLMNLCANARDSMADTGGALTISTAGVVLDERFCERHPSSPKLGDCVRLTIQDTGTGMAQEVVAHLFEPFFTTKQMGRGAGLGLAVVCGLVKQHEGFIDVDTAPGRGTAFHLYFSRDRVAAPVPTAPSSLAGQRDGNGSAPPPQARRRVLVVDDDPPILHLCRRILEGPYDVTTVTSGREALDELQRSPVDVLLLDIIMPEMDGFELLRRVRQLPRPVAHVLAMTGSLTEDGERRLLGASLSAPLIRKPFSGPALLEAVNHCLAPARPPNGSGG